MNRLRKIIHPGEELVVRTNLYVLPSITIWKVGKDGNAVLFNPPVSLKWQRFGADITIDDFEGRDYDIHVILDA